MKKPSDTTPSTARSTSGAGSAIALVGVVVPVVLANALRGRSTAVVAATYSGYFMAFMGAVGVVFAKRGKKRVARVALVAVVLAAVLFVYYMYLVFVS